MQNFEALQMHAPFQRVTLRSYTSPANTIHRMPLVTKTLKPHTWRSRNAYSCIARRPKTKKTKVYLIAHFNCANVTHSFGFVATAKGFFRQLLEVQNYEALQMHAPLQRVTLRSYKSPKKTIHRMPILTKTLKPHSWQSRNAYSCIATAHTRRHRPTT